MRSSGVCGGVRIGEMLAVGSSLMIICSARKSAEGYRKQGEVNIMGLGCWAKIDVTQKCWA